MIREQLQGCNMSVAELAQRAGLAEPVVAGLLRDRGASEQPRFEQVVALARVFERAPAELVAGTEAESVIDGWVPRAALEEEVRKRVEAETTAEELRVEVKELSAGMHGLCSTVERLSAELERAKLRVAEIESQTRARLRALRGARNAASFRLSAALNQRNQALVRARQNYLAWSKARSQILQLKDEAASSAESSWMMALIGAASAAVCAAETLDPGRHKVIRRRPRRRSLSPDER